MNATTSSTQTYGLLLFVIVMVTGFVLLIHSALTSIEVPDDIFTDCVGAQVLDPVTHTCGGI